PSHPVPLETACTPSARCQRPRAPTPGSTSLPSHNPRPPASPCPLHVVWFGGASRLSRGSSLCRPSKRTDRSGPRGQCPPLRGRKSDSYQRSILLSSSFLRAQPRHIDEHPIVPLRSSTLREEGRS